MSWWESFQVRPHDRLRSTELGGTHDLVHRRGARTQHIVQGLEGEIDPELVAIAEAVHHGAGRRGDANRHAKRRPAELRRKSASDRKSGRCAPVMERWAGLRALRSRAIQISRGNWVPISWNWSAVSRHTTAVRDGSRHHRERLELRGGNLGQSIESVAEVLHHSPGDEPLELPVGDSERGEVARPEEGADARFLQVRRFQ